MPSDNSTGGQALNLCSTRCGAVCGSAQCRFLYFVVFMFVFFAFCILKSKSLLGQMWRCLWITSVSLQLTTSLSHHPSVTKPAQDVMLYTFSVGSYINSYILKAWNYWGRWNAIDDVNGLSMEEEDGDSQGRQIMADKSISGRHLHFPFNWGSQKIFSTTKGDSGKVGLLCSNKLWDMAEGRSSPSWLCPPLSTALVTCPCPPPPTALCHYKVLQHSSLTYIFAFHGSWTLYRFLGTFLLPKIPVQLNCFCFLNFPIYCVF